MTTRKITIEEQHEILMTPGSAAPLSGEGVGLIIPTLRMQPDAVMVMDVTKDDWDFMGAMATGHAGSLVSPPCGAPDGLKRLNVILSGKTGKGKTTKFKKGGKHGR